MTKNNKYKARARKAVLTRKANATKRSNIAKKAWVTRKLNAFFDQFDA